jgi:beta-mannosidase
MKQRKAAETEPLPLFLWKYLINAAIFRNLAPLKIQKMSIKKVLFLNMVIAFAFGCQPKEKNPNLMVQNEINENWQFRQAGETDWMDATVPGTVHTDLMDNGVIDDPYYRLNELNIQWIDKEDWEYKTTFTVHKNMLSRDRVELDFKGLDTYANVFVNGEQILAANNMFREWQVDAKEFLKEGENELRILFQSPIKIGL